MLENEEAIQERLNEVGTLATQEVLSRFDADGSPIRIGDVRFTSKGSFPEKYQTPYGSTCVKRHVYQSSAGGRTFCPLEYDARMVLNSTPRFAKMVTFKYAHASAPAVLEDLKENHGRTVALVYIKDLADFVGTIAQAKEELWGYELPSFPEEVNAISIGLDGTCMYLREDGYREAMTGTIAFYNRAGKRMHTIYIAAPPEYGKSRFLERFKKEILRVKAELPDPKYIGLSDGASDHWDFLAPLVDRQVLDFFHASEYVGDVAQAAFGSGTKARDEARNEWVEDALHRLKHKYKAAESLLDEMKTKRTEVKGKLKQKKMDAAITYFENHYHQMWYSRQVRQKMPIASGVTEAACKVIVKQRLGIAGARWKEDGAASILSVRPLVLTPGRWHQFWSNISRYGVAV
jgi:hypothetical protein